MHKALVVTLVLLGYSTASADSFDIVTFKPPLGFARQVEENRLVFAKASGQSYCILGLYRSAGSSTDARQDHAADWAGLAATPFQITSTPAAKPGPKLRGWTTLHTISKATIEGGDASVGVTTFSGSGVRVSVLMFGNDKGCPKALAAWTKSFALKAPATPPEATATVASTTVTTTPTSEATATTNGWTSTARADWVEVAGKSALVLLHYPHAKADAYNSVLADGLRNAWDILVAPHYKQVRNLQLRPIQSFESIAFAEAEATDARGNNVYVVLFKKHASNGSGRYIEIITRDKATFEQTFGPYHNDEFGWDKLTAMAGYNRFPLSAKELAGTWMSTDFATISFYYVNGGGYAGATATSIANEFTFDAGGTYQSDHAGASGEVGRAKFSRQQYRGKYSIGNGQISLTNRFDGATETYAASFEAIKGGKILVLVDRLGTQMALVKRK